MKRYPACFAHMVGKSVARKRQIMHHIPGVMKCETMLYIGANPRRLELLDLFWAEAPQMKVDVLEAWEANVQGLNRVNAKHGIFRNIFHGDIMDAVDLLDLKYDVVMFWHGPEHLKLWQVPLALEICERLSRKYVIIGCPWGKFPQDAVDGNPFEEHKSHLMPDDFKVLGYKTDTIKKPNKRGGHILAWK